MQLLKRKLRDRLTDINKTKLIITDDLNQLPSDQIGYYICSNSTSIIIVAPVSFVVFFFFIY